MSENTMSEDLTAIFVIALTEGTRIVTMHDKIYFSEKKARRAFNTLKGSKKVSDRYAVYKVKSLDMDKAELEEKERTI